MRSLLIAVYEVGVEDIIIIGHHECGMQSINSELMIEKMKERHPLKRILNAEEVAAMASYLISDNARSITGQIIGIDAGMSSLRI